MKKTWLWLPVALWAGLIFVLSSMSSFRSVPLATGFFEWPGADKLAHFVFFGVLAGFCVRALRRGHAVRLPWALLAAILLTSAYGASDEWHQSFVPGRDCSVWDWLADSCGALIAAGIFYGYELRAGRKTDRGTP